MFRRIFFDTISSLTDDLTLADGLWADIVLNYSAAGRYYHTVGHLDHIGNELLAVRNNINNWDAVVLSIAYHDIVYDIQRNDNEEKSAAFAQSALQGLLKPESLEKCKQMILATKNHAQSPDPDINFFTDADLSILGAGAQAYRFYTEQIRKEFRYYPDAIYKPGRRKVLKHFLEMDRIYKSAYFYDKFERQARHNLQQEYDQLA